MKKTIIIAVAVLTIAITGFVAYNSSSAPSKNREGIMEITGPSDKDTVAADTSKQFSPI